MSTEKSVTELAKILGEKLTNLGLVTTTAESCSGGGVAYAITEISGSSQWFDRSFVTYSNQSKIQMLGVDEKLINNHGAVSEQVAEAMVLGAVKHAKANVGVAISGIAGPGGGTENKPVGTVCIAWYDGKGRCKSETFLFTGDRTTIRLLAIKSALSGLIKTLQ